MRTYLTRRADDARRPTICRLRFGVSVQRGFTLIELLVVIIIIAILASIAIPTFMGQRQHAQDANTYSLVRNALTAIQGAFVDTGDYTDITADELNAIEPSIVFVQSGDQLVSTHPAWISDAFSAQARDHQVAFYAESASVIDIASVSESGNLFGIQVNTISIAESGYVKVKVIEDSASLGW
jgi:prepilin-type N-terminal cleavage/methylation domain-containing protein